MVSDDEKGDYKKGETNISLNPCCNGIWSQTENKKKEETLKEQVLILVVMEYGLRRHGKRSAILRE